MPHYVCGPASFFAREVVKQKALSDYPIIDSGIATNTTQELHIVLAHPL